LSLVKLCGKKNSSLEVRSRLKRVNRNKILEIEYKKHSDQHLFTLVKNKGLTEAMSPDSVRVYHKFLTKTDLKMNLKDSKTFVRK
jgi:hypothetical protein